MFIRLHKTSELDGRTDGQTDRQTEMDRNGLAITAVCIASNADAL